MLMYYHGAPALTISLAFILTHGLTHSLALALSLALTDWLARAHPLGLTHSLALNSLTCSYSLTSSYSHLFLLTHHSPARQNGLMGSLGTAADQKKSERRNWQRAFWGPEPRGASDLLSGNVEGNAVDVFHELM